MAKVVWKTTPKAAYEWVEVEGGETMKDYERSALLDEFIAENGLVPVETTWRGETPDHKYGRYKVGGAVSALPPSALPTQEGDVAALRAKLTAAEAERDRAVAQLGKQPASKRAEIVDEEASDMGVDHSVGGAQTTDSARAVLNLVDGVDIVASGQEEREDMSTADRSDDNPKRGRGRPRKDD